jgi:hypothetical protein
MALSEDGVYASPEALGHDPRRPHLRGCSAQPQRLRQRRGNHGPPRRLHASFELPAGRSTGLAVLWTDECPGPRALH